MRHSSLAIVMLVLGLLLGAGGGYLLGLGGTASASERSESAPGVLLGPDSDSSSAVVPGNSEVDMGSVGALPVLAPRPSQGDDESGLTAAEASRASRAAASGLGRVAAAEPEDEPEGTAVITGTVVDELGVPLAGVTVVSYGTQSYYNAKLTAGTTENVGRGFPGIKALEEELGDYAENRVKSRKKTRLAVTDEAGAFTLDGLEEGTHPIQGFLEGHVFESVPAETGSVMQLISKRVGAFEFDVRLPDGTQPAEAIVMATDSDDRERAVGTWTPAEPTIRFTSTRIRCRVLSGEPAKVDWREVAAEFRSPLATLDLGVDGAGPHTLQLSQETQLRVQVIDESSILPRIDPWVSVRRLDVDGDEAKKLKRYRSGPFILTGLEPGLYEVTAGRGKSAPEATENVEVGAGLNETSITLGDVDPTRFLVVRCTAADGSPVTSIDFEYRADRKQGGSSSGDADASPKSPGVYWIDQAELGGSDLKLEELEMLSLTAKSAVMGQLTQEVDPGGGPIEFVFAQPGEVTVEVTGSLSGQLYVGLVPALKEDDDPNRWWQRRSKAVKTESDGTAQVGMVQPGNYEVELSKRTNEWNVTPAIATLSVTVKVGENRFSIHAPELTELVIHAPDMEVGAHFQLHRLGAEDRNPSYFGNDELDEDHRVQFEGLAPGRYMVNVWGETQAQMEITVPCGEVLFVADVVNGFEVTQVTDGKVADRAGLRKGDVILAVNEHQVDGNGFLNRFWVELSEGPSTIQVLRGGREIQIELEKLAPSANPWGAFGAYMTARALEGR
ncbi:hypothetical protein Poly30_37430 [Planctomycetes bacterium Poly30]|uniref:PDZ domain-containing protein n=1 Tax=Saltatorellus ferox TaxID=2528018 RepID=A0A518EVU7_9BACT|nr:hypothetical protein Poly30_37430 [Planctomycetes bacterium Poly30]